MKSRGRAELHMREQECGVLEVDWEKAMEIDRPSGVSTMFKSGIRCGHVNRQR